MMYKQYLTRVTVDLDGFQVEPEMKKYLLLAR
jgi:hypothetical protein